MDTWIVSRHPIGHFELPPPDEPNPHPVCHGFLGIPCHYDSPSSSAPHIFLQGAYNGGSDTPPDRQHYGLCLAHKTGNPAYSRGILLEWDKGYPDGLLTIRLVNGTNQSLHYWPAAIAFRGFFCVSSNRRISTSHCVLWQICLDPAFTASENSVRPAARSTASTERTFSKSSLGAMQNVPGIMKLVNGVSSGITALGSTNAPVLISKTSGVNGEEGFDVKTTFAKCVGTATFGGEPITSCVC